jgi:hypothetical protein
MGVRFQPERLADFTGMGIESEWPGSPTGDAGCVNTPYPI